MKTTFNDFTEAHHYLIGFGFKQYRQDGCLNHLYTDPISGNQLKLTKDINGKYIIVNLSREPKIGDVVQQFSMYGAGRTFTVVGIDETFNGIKRAWDAEGKAAAFVSLKVLDREISDDEVFNLLSNMG